MGAVFADFADLGAALVVFGAVAGAVGGALIGLARGHGSRA